MSKNVQMDAITLGAARPTAGRPSVTQGRYGARGNLELLVPDAVDGLWVFWFNADLPGDPDAAGDVPTGTWSAGLHFAAGTRYLEAQVLQSPLPHGHLEVVALTADGVLEAWWWSAGPGFQRRVADLAAGITDGVAAFDAAISTRDGGTLELVVRTRDGALCHTTLPLT